MDSFGLETYVPGSEHVLSGPKLTGISWSAFLHRRLAKFKLMVLMAGLSKHSVFLTGKHAAKGQPLEG